MPEHLHTGAIPVMGAHCCVGDSSFDSRAQVTEWV